MTETIQQFDYSVDLLKAILWQYSEASNLKSLLEQKQTWYEQNQEEFWQDWYRDVFDLRTANDFGLAVWSIILGIPLYITKGPASKPVWGFGQYRVNFTRGNFNNSGGASYYVGTEAARILLRLRYYQLIGVSCVPEINRALADVFKNYGPAYVIDDHDMTQFYVFTFPLPSSLIFLFDSFDILPRPAGVGSSYRVVVEETWGFGQYHENFDHGNFSEL